MISLRIHSLQMDARKRIRRVMPLWLTLAGLYSLYAAVIRMRYGTEPFDAAGVTFAGAIIGYFACALVAAVVVGILLPVRLWPCGRFLISVPTALIVVFSVMMVRYGIPFHWHLWHWIVLAIIGLFFGVAGGVAWWIIELTR